MSNGPFRIISTARPRSSAKWSLMMYVRYPLSLRNVEDDLFAVSKYEDAAEKFSSVHAQVHNQFNQERRLVTRQVYKQRRSIALTEWRALAG